MLSSGSPLTLALDPEKLTVMPSTGSCTNVRCARSGSGTTAPLGRRSNPVLSIRRARDSRSAHREPPAGRWV